jgi:hypothetical protein
MVTEDCTEDCWTAFNKEYQNQLLEKKVCNAWVEPQDFEAPYCCKIANVIQLTLTFMQISHKQSSNHDAISINSKKRKILKKTVCDDNYLSNCIYMSNEDEGWHNKSM